MELDKNNFSKGFTINLNGEYILRIYSRNRCFDYKGEIEYDKSTIEKEINDRVSDRNTGLFIDVCMQYNDISRVDEIYNDIMCIINKILIKEFYLSKFNARYNFTNEESNINWN